MARNIAADATAAWRAVLVFKTEEGALEYVYEGIYNNKGTAKGRVTYWVNHQRYKDELGIASKCRFYDGWVEQADILWYKEKD